MLHPVLKRLRQVAPLRPDDEKALVAVFSSTITVRQDGGILHEGKPLPVMMVLLSGMACRAKHLDGNLRQISAIVLPGDVCDFAPLFMAPIDQDVIAVVDCELAVAKRQSVLDLIAAHPNVARAFWSLTIAEEAVLREWTVNLGRRAPDQRVAHFLCEHVARHRDLASAGGDRCPLPLTLAQLADVVGLTPAHVNLIIRSFQSDGLLSWRSGVLTIGDWRRLSAVAEFSETYLRGYAENRQVEAV